MAPTISLLVPTMGNPWHLNITVRSALEGAESGVEALVFSNQHGEETQKVVDGFTRDALPARLIGVSENNDGVALAVNACAKAAVGEFLFYVGDDMFFLPGWDAALLRRIKPNEWQYLTPRSIEPTGENPCMYAPHDFGRGPDDFREDDLLAFWDGLEKEDVISRYGPPFVRAEYWQAMGGFDPGFWPGFGTDPDFAIRLAKTAHQRGKHCDYLGVGDCGAYHFQCVTTARIRSYGATLAANLRFQDKHGLATYDFGASIHEGKRPEDAPR